ncbi:cytochrome c oxidase accessory protein CcoG [Arcobacter sp. FWKO B]|uniref:cytochrome c oxidase accessory protein CcoG n=1 Tax=Arcobacter sp. FWKO B TaxID=2593672 RepID=UPI0018A5F339|nr:cytochrome c oxidase accessory protein CcoG [Arcobacter sp. FWKO B]QOG12394.1 cytochrome c oxidase accessory protein CcoG [Arcobacter sp. FWKO B]
MSKESTELEVKSPYRIKRYYMYMLATIVAIVTPFITINGNHMFLLSFDKKQLHLLGIAFDMQELYMMPFLLMLLFLGIFAVTAIGGRAWCGWTCPQTIFRVIYRDFIEGKLLGLRRIKNKQKEPDWSKPENASKRVVAILIWSALSLLVASNFMWYFIPPEDFFAYISNPTEHMFMIGFVLILAAFLVYDVIMLKEDFCVYICPYSRVQSVLYDDNTYQAIYSTKRGGTIYDDQKNKIIFKQKDLPDPQNECTACESCVTVCPTHIDIRKGMQLECINCLECVDACTTVMGKLGRPSLVQWTSTNEIEKGQETKVVRKNTIMYGVALVLIVGMLFVMGGKKEYMLLNINKTTQLYHIDDDNKVSNNFLFLFQNTERVAHEYNLEVIGEYADKMTIERFEPFELSPKKMAKKVVILSTTEKLVDDIKKDTPITVQIRAYSTTEPERVSVIREAVFIYPRADKLK